jgi:ubiquinone/menaquinone biosynthesis C-methylase UbiE
MNNDDDEMSPTERFSDRVDDYDKYRPGYPRDALHVLAREAGMKPNAVLADVGSGTGILTKMLLDNGNTVYAIEPNEPMRRAAERRLNGRVNFISVDGTAEATTLADKSVDAVVVAQAFHWFDHAKALAEFKRITRRGGFVALIWNARIPTSSPMNADYEQVVHTFGTDFARSGKELVSTAHLHELLGRSMKLCTLHNEQALDWHGLRGRLQSASYMPSPGQSRFDEMIDALQKAFDAHQKAGVVRLIYDTRVYLARL